MQNKIETNLINIKYKMARLTKTTEGATPTATKAMKTAQKRVAKNLNKYAIFNELSKKEIIFDSTGFCLSYWYKYDFIVECLLYACGIEDTKENRSIIKTYVIDICPYDIEI